MIGTGHFYLVEIQDPFSSRQFLAEKETSGYRLRKDGWGERKPLNSSYTAPWLSPSNHSTHQKRSLNKLALMKSHHMRGSIYFLDSIRSTVIILSSAFFLFPDTRIRPMENVTVNLTWQTKWYVHIGFITVSVIILFMSTWLKRHCCITDMVHQLYTSVWPHYDKSVCGNKAVSLFQCLKDLRNILLAEEQTDML